MSDSVLTAVLIACVIAAFLVGLVTKTPIHITRAEAVTHGCAEYNQTTGEFQWKGEK
jgi:hypothetical protein